ncbi:MAG: hypothetical protein AAFX93_12170 [Verrucomicrobiota bacterium]
MRTTKAVAALFLIAIASSALNGFDKPKGAYPYKVEPFSERLETMDIERVRLNGQRVILMDSASQFQTAKPTKGESVVLKKRFFPDYRMELYVFPNSSIRGSISKDNVSKYVKGLSEDAIRRQEFLEVLTMPEDDSAPTKIRFLGAKPISVSYAVKKVVDGDLQRVVVMDNWAQLDGETYLLRITAPEANFESFFSECRGLANSMYFAG